MTATRTYISAHTLRFLRVGVLLALVTLPSIAGCQCGVKKTDEERLKERIDTTSVHLYVALKIALTKSGGSPAVVATRVKLLRVIAASADLYQRTSTGTPPSVDATAALRNAADATRDVAEIAVALYQLRAQGAAIVRGEREDDLSPVLPDLLAGFASPELLTRLDGNGEHAVLLMAFFVLKTHPKSPIPIPDEIILYEASRTDAATLRFVGLRPVVRAVKAWILGNGTYCDLAARESAAIPAHADDAWRAAIRDDFRVLDAPLSDDDQLTTLHAATRGLAHGESAVCYLDRGEREKADDELQELVDAAQEMGLPPEDIAPIRAYLAWRHDDLPAAKRHLQLARTSPRLDDRQREAFDELITYIDNRDPRFGEHFDRAFFTLFAARLFFDALERAHIVDQLVQTPLYQKTRAFVVSTGRVIGASQQVAPQLRDSASRAYQRLRHKKPRKVGG